MGYSKNFKLAHYNEVTNEGRIADPIARLFLEPAFSAILAIVEGKIASEAYKISQQKYLENLRVLIANNNTELNTTVAARLYHNFKCQVCLGSQRASF